ncbi:MAG: DUF2190 family protein [Rubrivivax sp.]|jgi:predicted RecA/RadA family phage recombinase|nr:DUF2190 family protein [Rubrivivax sp.]
MKNFVQPGDKLTVIAPYAVTSGQGVLVGLLFGVAQHDAANGAPVELQMSGVVDLNTLGTDTASGTSLVLAYWDNTNRRVTTAASGNTKIGMIVEAKVNGPTISRVRLNGAF